MTDIKISQLPPLLNSDAVGLDTIPIYDQPNTATKAIALSELDKRWAGFTTPVQLVANFAGLPPGAINGTLAFTLDTSTLYLYNGAAWVKVLKNPASLTSEVSGVLPLANGGTNASNATAARSSLGAAASGANADITSLAGLTTPLSVAQGGTGSGTAGGARTSLGAAASGANADITSLTALTTDITIAQGGTGQSTQQAAIDALTGTQSSGKYLRSDGTHATLSNIQAADVPTLNQNTTGTAASLSAVLSPTLGGLGAANNAANILSFVGNFSLGLTLSANSAVTLPTSGTLATLAGSETLSNKTLGSTNTATGINMASWTPDGGSHTLTAPTVTDTLAVLAATQTFSSKSFDTTCKFIDTGGGSKSILFDLSGANGNTSMKLNCNQSANRTVTFPDLSDVLVGRITTDTMSNKTLLAPVIATISNGGTLTLPSGADTLVARTSTDTLTNKTLTAPVMSSYEDFTEIASPSSPGAGVLRVYSKNDDKLYIKNSGGTEAALLTSNSGSFGSVPVGGIVPIMANITGSYSLPASGTVDGSGWMRCDGAAIPASQTLSGSTPNLTSGNFIYGTSGSGSGANVLAGATGGSNTTTLSTANLASHGHTGGSLATSLSLSGSTPSLTGTVTFASASHYHLLPIASAFSSHGIAIETSPNGFSGTIAGTASTTSPQGYTPAAAASTGSRHTSYSATGTASVGISGGGYSLNGSNGVTGSTDANGSGTAFNTLPAYVAAVYLIRVI